MPSPPLGTTYDYHGYHRKRYGPLLGALAVPVTIVLATFLVSCFHPVDLQFGERRLLAYGTLTPFVRYRPLRYQSPMPGGFDAGITFQVGRFSYVLLWH